MRSGIRSQICVRGRVGNPTSPPAELARKLKPFRPLAPRASPTANSSSSSTTSWLNMECVGDRENHCHAKGGFLVRILSAIKTERPEQPVYRFHGPQVPQQYKAAGGEHRAARWRASPVDLSIDWQPHQKPTLARGRGWSEIREPSDRQRPPPRHHGSTWVSEGDCENCCHKGYRSSLHPSGDRYRRPHATCIQVSWSPSTQQYLAPGGR